MTENISGADMKEKCKKCDTQLNQYGECAECKKRMDAEENERRQRVINLAMGDGLNTGIPGGLDMDITTPF